MGEFSRWIWPFGLRSSTVLFLAIFSLTQVHILSNSSWHGNSYRGISTCISKATIVCYIEPHMIGSLKGLFINPSQRTLENKAHQTCIATKQCCYCSLHLNGRVSSASPIDLFSRGCGNHFTCDAWWLMVGQRGSISRLTLGCLVSIVRDFLTCQ